MSFLGDVEKAVNQEMFGDACKKQQHSCKSVLDLLGLKKRKRQLLAVGRPAVVFYLCGFPPEASGIGALFFETY